MKNKKLKYSILFLLLLTIGWLFGALMFPFPLIYNKKVREVPKSSVGEITIIKPENKTYTEPDSGYYPGTYNFDNEIPITYGTDTKFLDEYHGSSNYNWLRICREFQGHYNVLDMFDAQGGLNTWGVHYFTEPHSFGTIEFYLIFTGRDEIATRRHYLNFRAIDDTIGFSVMLELHDGDIMYYNGSSWVELAKALEMQWYHHSMSFDCNAGTNGQFNWTVCDEQGIEISRVENFEFENNLSTLGEIYMGTLVGDYGGGSLWDAFSFSWDPDYSVGDNKHEGLLLSCDITENLDWNGYSLDGKANKTILGNSTIPMPSDGIHNIQVFGNDSMGMIYESDLRYFTVNTAPPEITINSPTDSQVIGSNAPSYDISINGLYESIWYALEGSTNYTASGLTGTINQAAWSALVDGIITIDFYTNNSAGMEGTAQVQVFKDTSEKPSPNIPGYDFYILFGVLSIVSLFIIKKRLIR